MTAHLYLKPVTRKEAMERLGVSIRTVDRMIADNTLPARKLKRAVRIDREAFEKFLDSAWKVQKPSNPYGSIVPNTNTVARRYS